MSEEIDTKKLLRGLARQLSGDRNSMAYLLANYRQQRGLTEAQLAEELHATPEMLVRLSICRSPEADSAELDSQIASLAAYCEVDRAALTHVIEFTLTAGYGVTAPSQPALQPGSMVATGIAHAPSVGSSSQTISLFRRPRVWAVGLSFAILLSASIALVWRTRGGQLSPGTVTETPEIAGSQHSSAVVENPKQESPGASPPPPHTESARSSTPEELARRSTTGRAHRAANSASGRIARENDTLQSTDAITVDLDAYNNLRGGGSVGDEKVIALPPARTKLFLTLPHGSPEGLYTVRVVDAFGRSLVVSRARSRDGTNLLVHLDLRGFAHSASHLCLERRSEVPDCYRIVVEAQGHAK